MRSAVLAGLVLLAGCEKPAPVARETATEAAGRPADPAPSAIAIATDAAGAAEARPKGMPAETQPPKELAMRFQALGTEPFWGVDIRGGGRLVYSTPENIGGTQALYSLTVGKGPLQYDWKLGKQSYRLVLERGTCSDGMSDRVYDWKATLTIDGKTERGCAIAK